jgi:hypothetical protein
MRIHHAYKKLKPTTMKNNIYTEIELNLIAGIPVQVEVMDENGQWHEHNYASTNMLQIEVDLKRTYSGQLIDAMINQLGLNYATLSIDCSIN